MAIGKLHFSAHAWKRMTQRGHLTLTDVLTVVAYGRRVHRAHADFYCLLARNLRNLPADKEKDLSRLVGTVVCVEGRRVSTVFKNRNAVAKIRKKRKRYHGERRDTLVHNLQVPVTIAA
jgi:hypothetical protein